MLHHFSQWKQSGLNKRQYCIRESLSYQAFCKFCSRQNEPVIFNLIRPKVGEVIVKLHLPNGCYFSIPSDCSVQLLQKLISFC
ncbi:MAG: IS66 family insertion sequence element accessory protein TnpA [Bacteroidia bacterium]